MSATSATDAWAVGNSNGETLILHWDGTSWSQVESPSPSPIFNQLVDVSAVSATNAWAVGYRDDTTDLFDEQELGLTFHWDGTSWSQVDSPNPSSTVNELRGVSARSATDAWAVGYYQDDGIYKTLVLHWDGTTWSRIRAPNPSSVDNGLEDVNVRSATDAWAVGSYRPDGQTPETDTLILHWDGTEWSKVRSPSPNTRSHSGALWGVSASAAHNAWAVGFYGVDTRAGGSTRTLVLHWDGTRWSKVTSPNPSRRVNYLLAVSGTRSRDAWAVGQYRDETSRADDTLILYWDGTEWSKVRSPSPSATDNGLSSVHAAVTDAWAVGSYADDTTGVTDALVLHWDGTRWSRP